MVQLKGWEQTHMASLVYEPTLMSSATGSYVGENASMTLPPKTSPGWMLGFSI